MINATEIGGCDAPNTKLVLVSGSAFAYFFVHLESSSQLRATILTVDGLALVELKPVPLSAAEPLQMSPGQRYGIEVCAVDAKAARKKPLGRLIVRAPLEQFGDASDDTNGLGLDGSPSCTPKTLGNCSIVDVASAVFDMVRDWERYVYFRRVESFSISLLEAGRGQRGRGRRRRCRRPRARPATPTVARVRGERKDFTSSCFPSSLLHLTPPSLLHLTTPSPQPSGQALVEGRRREQTPRLALPLRASKRHRRGEEGRHALGPDRGRPARGDEDRRAAPVDRVLDQGGRRAAVLFLQQRHVREWRGARDPER